MPSEQVISNILTEWKGIHLRKDRNPVGTVRTGIEYVNRLFLNAQWSWKNAMLDVITDERRTGYMETVEQKRGMFLDAEKCMQCPKDRSSVKRRLSWMAVCCPTGSDNAVG